MYNYYCTTCSMDYCYQGLVLYNSIARHDKDFKLFIVCQDDKMVQFLNTLHYSNLVPIDVSNIEDTYKGLLVVKQVRNLREYAWTLKPSIVLYIFKNFDYADRILWLDSDMQFLSSPEPLNVEWSSLSILLSEQYYTDSYKSLVSVYGKFQAGFIGFRRDGNGMECLRWWQEKCLEWCSDKADNGKWADQKYLDEFPQRFEGVGVVHNLGINLTPFIVYRVNDEQREAVVKKSDGLYINDVRIILYHYYGFRFYDNNEYDLSCYWMTFDEETIKLLYIPYIKECQDAIRVIKGFYTHEFQLISTDKNQVSNYYSWDRYCDEQFYDICVITDKSDLIKCLALYYSIIQNTRRVHVWICCIDEFSFTTLKNAKLDNVTITHSRSFETKEMLEYKKTCDIKEYKSILKPHYLYYLIKNNFSINYLLLVSTDIYFYKNPAYLLKEFENGSIFLYRLPKPNEESEGSYKTDLIGFRRDNYTQQCLISWKNRSIRWHLEKTDVNEYPEDSFINTWPSCLSGVKVLENKYVNAEPQDSVYYRIISYGDRIKYINPTIVLLNFHGYNLDYSSIIDGKCLDDIYKNKFIDKTLQKKHRESVKRAVQVLKRLPLNHFNYEGSLL